MISPTEVADVARSVIENTSHLREVADGCPIVWHGSMTAGVDDAYADVDLWVLLPTEADAARVIAAAGTGFFALAVGSRAGHLNVDSVERLSRGVDRADLPLIAELHHAVPLVDATGTAARLIERARQPMSDGTRLTFVRHHYVEMRSEHRGADNPLNRNDPTAVLLAVGKTLGHALRMACALDGEPYPYDKWLRRAASQTPAGRAVLPHADRLIAAIGEGALNRPSPEQTHPINTILRELRATLVALAAERGISGRWLDQWWLHMDESRDAIQNVSWP